MRTAATAMHKVILNKCDTMGEFYSIWKYMYDAAEQNAIHTDNKVDLNKEEKKILI